MPSFNLLPTLYPQSNTNDLYKSISHLLNLKQQNLMINEGGDFKNPNTIDVVIKDWEELLTNPNLTEANRRSIEGKIVSLEKTKVQTQFDRRQDIDVSFYNEMIQRDLRELEYSYPDNMIAYSSGAYESYYNILRGVGDIPSLDEQIEILENNYADTSRLKQLKSNFEDELEKFDRIMLAVQSGDINALNDYAIIYTPNNGKVNSMDIISRDKTFPAGSYQSDLKFSVGDKGNLLITDESGDGMNIFFLRSKPSDGELIRMGNIGFIYDGINKIWESKNPQGFQFDRIKHTPSYIDTDPGTFVEDDKGRLFYKNIDNSLMFVTENQKEALGYSPDKVYKLSLDEQENTLPGAIDAGPSPVFEKANIPYPSILSGEFGKAFQETPERLGRVEEAFKEGLKIIGGKTKEASKSFWETSKESFIGGVKDVMDTIQGKGEKAPTIQEEPTKWGAEGLKEGKTFKVAKEMIEGWKKLYK